ncbi:flagellin [Clostridium sp. KNHs205]|jgi:flagellin|uniref:flagellin N-terminal helical domain-containing protein n=1 Tax=Clostridium sp. KNHs205 TaxID=1449050 RepID=UPI00051ABAFF|nr:flagellin [Clostridium sp. KNHs205]
MIVQHNMAAANTNRQLGITNSNLAKKTEKLSSGYKINRAGDDAAGLSISEKMRGQIRGLEQASTNAQDGISLIQTAEGALNETHSILQRMRELTVQAANDTNVTADRDAIKEEIGQLSSELSRIATQTEFNKQKLLDGSLTAVNLQVGANEDQSISFSIDSMDATNLSVDSLSGEVSDYAAATAALTTIDTALESVSKQRSLMGAMQNRLEHTIANADNTAENLQASESRIRDVDMAKEMVGYSKDSILQQAAQSMLAQANQATQGVLSLLR